MNYIRFKKIIPFIFSFLLALWIGLTYLPSYVLNHYILQKLVEEGLQDISYRKISLSWQTLKVRDFSFATSDGKHRIAIEEFDLTYSPFSLATWQLKEGRAKGLRVHYTPSPSLIPPIDTLLEASREAIPHLNRFKSIHLEDVQLILAGSPLPPLSLKITEHHENKLAMTVTGVEQTVNLLFSLDSQRITFNFNNPDLKIASPAAMLHLTNLIGTAIQEKPGAAVDTQLNVNVKDFSIPPVCNLKKEFHLKVSLTKDKDKTKATLALFEDKNNFLSSELMIEEEQQIYTGTTIFRNLNLSKWIEFAPPLIKSNAILKEMQDKFILNGALSFNTNHIKSTTLTIDTLLYGGTASISEISSKAPHLLNGIIFNLSLSGLNLGKLAAAAEMPNLQLEGNLSGSGTLKVSDKGLEVIKATLESSHQGGQLRYKPEKKLGDLPSETKLALTALEDFNFTTLMINLEPTAPEQQDLQAIIRIKGSNPKVLNSYPFEFNIRTTGKLLELLNNTLNSFSQPQSVKDINKRYGVK